MAIVNYSPWQDAANYGQGLGSSLTNLMIALPQIRQQQLLNAAHMGLYGEEARHAAAQTKLVEAQTLSEPITSAAHAAYYKAEADRAIAQGGLYGAQKDEITHEGTARAGLAQAFRNFADAGRMGLDQKPFISDMVDNVARLSDKDRTHVLANFYQALEANNPRYRQALGLGSQMTVPIGPGATAYGNVSGLPEYQSPRVLGYGQQLFDKDGQVLATGQDRPLADALHSGVFNAAAKAYFDPMATAEERTGILGSIPQFLRSLPGTGMPRTAPPIVPRIVRDPKTGQLVPEDELVP